MIDDMSDQEKSVMLARAMGWEVTFAYSPAHPQLWIPDDLAKAHKTKFIANLYDPASMALAWRVLNWVAKWDLNQQSVYYTQFYGWWDNNDLWAMPPAAAQRAWLDKILTLAKEGNPCQAVNQY